MNLGQVIEWGLNKALQNEKVNIFVGKEIELETINEFDFIITSHNYADSIKNYCIETPIIIFSMTDNISVSTYERQKIVRIINPTTTCEEIRNFFKANNTCVSRINDNSYSFHKLNEREKCILVLAFRGKTNYEISEELFLSKRTVEYHLTKAYKKLKVKSRIQAFSKVKGINEQLFTNF